MKILHIVNSLYNHSGVSVFAAELANAQTVLNNTVSVWCEEVPWYSVGRASLLLNEYKCKRVVEDVVHIHALWVGCSVVWMIKCLIAHKPYVVSPHGSLMPRVFQKGRVKKWVFWRLFLRPLLLKANAIHCTSEAEKEACKNLGLRGPFIVAPLGVHLPNISRPRPYTASSHTVLFLGRLSEEKGLINLLDAWKAVGRKGWTLKIAGPDWLGYRKVLDEKIAREGILHVEFPGVVAGEEKDKLYREADVFVLSSPMENFSMVILEALAYGVPAIATKGTPWGELERENCGWWIDQGVAPLKEALMKAMSLTDEERMAIGANGRRLATDKYQWSSVAAKLLGEYAKIIRFLR